MKKRGITPDSFREYSLWAIIRRLMTYIRPYSAMAVTAFVLSMSSSLLLVIRPYFIKTAIDNYLTKGNLVGFDRFMLLFAGIYVISVVVSSVC